MSEPILPIELEVVTCWILHWDKVYLTANLLAMYICQLQCRDNDFQEVTLHLQCMQLKRKDRYDEKYDIWHKELASSDIVLLYNIRREKDMSRKLIFQ